MATHPSEEFVSACRLADVAALDVEHLWPIFKMSYEGAGDIERQLRRLLRDYHYPELLAFRAWLKSAGPGSEFQRRWQAVVWQNYVGKVPDDWVDEVVAKFFRNLAVRANYRFKKPFKHYLRVILGNAFREVLREFLKLKPIVQLDGAKGVVSPRSIERDAQAVEAYRAYLAELDRLPPSDRSIVRLRFHCCWSVKDIAAVLNMKPNTVSKRLRRTLETLKSRLEGGGFWPIAAGM